MLVMVNKKCWRALILIFLVTVLVSAVTKDSKAPSRRMEILFLGHNTNQHHNSEKLASILTKEYFKSGINITFTTDPGDLNEVNLSNYDGLILYANHDTISQ